MERYGGGRIVIHDYDPGWSVLFEQEQARILEALGSAVMTIEHVGSTSVAGLTSKPIVDLLVGVHNLPDARTLCVEPLQALGHTYLP